MPDTQWIIKALSPKYDRDAFDCGQASLNDFFRKYALQNQKKNISRTFVACDQASSMAAGYYTISSGSVAFAHLPAERQKGLPKYPLPVVHMGRLAVANSAQGQGLGAFLLVDALRRVQRISSDLGICGMEVNALDDRARAFYLKYGFTELADDKLHLYLPMSLIQQLVFSS